MVGQMSYFIIGGTNVAVGQMSYFFIGGTNVGVGQMLGWDKRHVGQMSVGQMSVALVSVGQKLRHRLFAYHYCSLNVTSMNGTKVITLTGLYCISTRI